MKQKTSTQLFFEPVQLQTSIIQKFEDLERLQQNWYDNATVPINNLTLKAARETLKFYGQMMNEMYHSSPKFEISPGLDGWIDVRLFSTDSNCTNVFFSSTEMIIYEARFEFQPTEIKYQNLFIAKDQIDTLFLADRLFMTMFNQKDLYAKMA